ncbi:ribonuclease III domain-containing protein [Cantharellus anzutake]|uniref:ribonuclease III domain-containing protein n=1 Tax=Cantharellus anzutake TaxID=1750568 RepID=UPI001903CEA0|nr:ribonuclease III domain-containing protein [Cantharellus anzutake]KAF8333142.1 ribonuclease III domain-containing protein [Cantharellus anzutake]
MTPDGHLDNRRLEWLGDSVIQLSVTLLLEELYPHLRTTMVHFIRCRVISNNNLGAISRKYRLYKRYREVSGIEIRDLPSSKVHADLLEAYIGAVYKEMQFSELHPFLVALFKPSVTAACHVHQQLPHEPRLKITTWDDETGTYRPESASPRDWRSVALPVENTYERFLATCRSLGFSPRFEYEEERDGRGSLSVRVTIYDDAKYIATGFGVTSYQARAEASEIAIRRVIQLANANDGYSSRDNGLPAGPSRASTNANANPAPNDAGSFRKRRRSSILLSTHS